MNSNKPEYSQSFFGLLGEHSIPSARAIAPIVYSLVRPSSVVDIGCGIGAWLRAFAELGVSDYIGLDGGGFKPEQLVIDPQFVKIIDISSGFFKFNRIFDLAVCLEVAEHLPPRVSSTLVSSLTTCAPCVLFSAAIPGQGGTRHINEQWPAFWQQRFAARGYIRLDPVRPLIWRKPDIAWWFKQNIYLYCDKAVVSDNPGLKNESEIAEKCPFELIYANSLGPLMTNRAALVSVLRAIRKYLLKK